jgi:hypothetical protein
VHVLQTGWPCAAAAGPAAGSRILVVDDNEDAVQSLVVTSDQPEDAASPRRKAIHDLRGQLGTISNWVHALAESKDAAAILPQAVAAMDRAVRAAAELTETLREPPQQP